MASSSHNPFRSPAPAPTQTPQATGASSSSSAGAPPSFTSSAAPSDPTGLTEEAPPAYTPRPDVYEGEETIEYGPSRPFQPPPPAPAPAPGRQGHAPHPHQWPRPAAVAPAPQLISPSQSQSHTPSLWRQITGQLAAQLASLPPPSTSQLPAPHGQPAAPAPGGWSAYPGRHQEEPPHPGHGGGSHLQVPPPPPRHPSVASSTSDFARDFYAAGPEPSPSEYAPPPGPPPGPPRHPPPPGPPRQPTNANGRPTETPTPGHPLLRDGKLLVYPTGFECEKCHNYGYRHTDPSHPCKKCWSKYAKPFQGPLAYAYSSSSSTNTGEAGAGATTFQRPLPDFRPPHTTSPSHPPLPPRPSHNQSHNQHAPPPAPYPSFFPLPLPPPPPQLMNAGVNVRTLSPYAPPPPGAVVYPAGDPRLGGRACWNCAGRGSVSFLLFDSMACEVCGGLGRVF